MEAETVTRLDEAARMRLYRLDAMLGELEDLNLRDRPHVPYLLGSALESLGVDQPHTRSISELIDVVFDLQEPVLNLVRSRRRRRVLLAGR